MGRKGGRKEKLGSKTNGKFLLRNKEEEFKKLKEKERSAVIGKE